MHAKIRKKNHETTKEELLTTSRENDTEIEFNMTRITNPREAINVINHYEEIMKTRNKKIIEYIAIQGQMLKKFQETEGFIENKYNLGHNTLRVFYVLPNFSSP